MGNGMEDNFISPMKIVGCCWCFISCATCSCRSLLSSRNSLNYVLHKQLYPNRCVIHVYVCVCGGMVNVNVI